MVYGFRDVRFMSAAQKTTILRAWVRFMKSGLQFEQFTKALYNHLIQHCSFIAHYDRAGFYSYYFEAGDSTAHFLSQFDSRGPCSSMEYGGNYWLSGDCEDLNRAMKHGISAEEIGRSCGADRSTAEAPKAQRELLPYG